MNTFNVELTDEQWYNIMSGMIYALTISKKGTSYFKVSSTATGKAPIALGNYMSGYTKYGRFRLIFTCINNVDVSGAHDGTKGGVVVDSAEDQIDDAYAVREMLKGYYVDIQDRHAQKKSVAATFKVTLDTMGYPITAIAGNVAYWQGIVVATQSLALSNFAWSANNPFTYRSQTPEAGGNACGLNIYCGSDVEVNGVFDLFTFTVGTTDTTTYDPRGDYRKYSGITFGKHRCYAVNNYGEKMLYSEAYYTDADSKYGIMHRVINSDAEVDTGKTSYNYSCDELSGGTSTKKYGDYDVSNLDEFGAWKDIYSDAYLKALQNGYARVKGIIHSDEERDVYVGFGSKENPGATVKIHVNTGDNEVDIKIPFYYDKDVTQESEVYIKLIQESVVGESNANVYFKPGTSVAVENTKATTSQLPVKYEYGDDISIEDSVEVNADEPGPGPGPGPEPSSDKEEISIIDTVTVTY